MEINIHKDKKTTSKNAAERARQILIDTINKKGEAVFVIATGKSQLDFLNHLVQYDDIDWAKTKLFHLDEYIGIDEDHIASFRKYIKENFIEKIPEIKEINLIDGLNDPNEECKRLNRIIDEEKIDISFVGIGENGHLAFNDPPADFETKKSFIVVELDEISRKQQVNEGWFESLEKVPKKAITMSINKIMSSDNIICTVPEERKAKAVNNCFGNNIISSKYPASILKKHDNTYLYLDKQSAKLLD